MKMEMVGTSGFEPETSSMSTKRSNQLSYAPAACPDGRRLQLIQSKSLLA